MSSKLPCTKAFLRNVYQLELSELTHLFGVLQNRAYELWNINVQMGFYCFWTVASSCQCALWTCWLRLALALLFIEVPPQ